MPLQSFSHKYKKANKNTSTFGPSCIAHFKNTKKTYGTFWKPPFQNQPKSVLSPKLVQAMQL